MLELFFVFNFRIIIFDSYHFILSFIDVVEFGFPFIFVVKILKNDVVAKEKFKNQKNIEQFDSIQLEVVDVLM